MQFRFINLESASFKFEELRDNSRNGIVKIDDDSLYLIAEYSCGEIQAYYVEDGSPMIRPRFEEVLKEYHGS